MRKHYTSYTEKKKLPSKFSLKPVPILHCVCCILLATAACFQPAYPVKPPCFHLYPPPPPYATQPDTHTHTLTCTCICIENWKHHAQTNLRSRFQKIWSGRYIIIGCIVNSCRYTYQHLSTHTNAFQMVVYKMKIDE